MGDVFQDDPQTVRKYVRESVRAATIETIVRLLDETRMAAGLSKADVARAIAAEPATVRRLLSSSEVNPTLGTLAEVAAALGLRVSLEPLAPVDVRAITAPLRTGRLNATAVRRIGRLRASRRLT